MIEFLNAETEKIELRILFTDSFIIICGFTIEKEWRTS